MLLCAAGWLGPQVRADDADAGGARRAVRLSSVDGDVHLTQGNQQLADQALANTPLFEGTRIDTGDDGRAEIQFEDGSVARISPNSSLTLVVLKGGAGEERDSEVLLNGGLGYFELQGATDGSHMRVRFGDSVVTASGFTVLRISLDKPPGEVAVFSGNAHLEGSASPVLDLHGGESIALNATNSDNYNLAESIEPDSWDAWNSDRDQALTTASAGRTTASSNLPDSNNPAWNDLDSSGNWYSVPDQGYVWSPYEASSSGWDPYGYGSWMNMPGYGYQWVSGEPWGYMPYQCGAWNYYNSFGWGWAPGGCQPWWGGIGLFGGGWNVNIGTAPSHYRFPIRPSPRPHHPRPMGGGRLIAADPVISVNRHVLAGNSALPARDGNTPVAIAGTVVQPLRPVQVRVPYNHSLPVISSRPVGEGVGRSGYVHQSGVNPRPGNVYAPRSPGGSAPRPSGGSFGHSSAPVSHPAGGGGGGHPSGGGGGHPSGGGAHH
jgi:hypothetical protein